MCKAWPDPLRVHRGTAWGSLGFPLGVVAGGLTVPPVG
jgi:hypothetical protein